MSGPAGYRSSLARSAAYSPSPETELATLRRAAWRHQGVVVIRPEEVSAYWTRQALINEANRLYGLRPGGGQ